TTVFLFHSALHQRDRLPGPWHSQHQPGEANPRFAAGESEFVPTIDDYDKLIVKNNNVLSDKTFLNITYLFNDSRKKNARGAAPGEGLPSSYRDNPVRDQTLYANLIHVFNHGLTSETLLQYGRRLFNLEPKGLGFEPALGISDLLSSGGFVGSVRFYREQHFQIAQN